MLLPMTMTTWFWLLGPITAISLVYILMELAGYEAQAKAALAVLLFPFMFVLAALALIAVLLTSKVARTKWFSGRRHTSD